MDLKNITLTEQQKAELFETEAKIQELQRLLISRLESLENYLKNNSPSTSLKSNENYSSQNLQTASNFSSWERKLAYVEKIRDLEPIQGADLIEVATIIGWKVVVKKGQYQKGDTIVYAEIDSILPPWSTFVADKLDRNNFRIKTIKLKGQISQGYCIPLKALEEHPTRKMKLITNASETPFLEDQQTKEIIRLEIGTDLTEYIGIQKYEAPTSTFMKIGKAKPFPSFIPKTDQIRIQNLAEKVEEWSDVPFEITEKIEGSSITAFLYNGQFGICSRNYQILELETNENVAVRSLMQFKINEKLSEYGQSIALQGEFIGKAIQGNIYKLDEYNWLIFDVFLIDQKRFASPEERYKILNDLKLSDKHVPIIHKNFSIKGMKVPDFLKQAEGNSVLRKGCQREGLVFKSSKLVDGQIISFKAISNLYLLKNEM